MAEELTVLHAPRLLRDEAEHRTSARYVAAAGPFARDGGQVVNRPLDLVNSIDRKLPLQTFDSNEYLSRIGE